MFIHTNNHGIEYLFKIKYWGEQFPHFGNKTAVTIVKHSVSLICFADTLIQHFSATSAKQCIIRLVLWPGHAQSASEEENNSLPIQKLLPFWNLTCHGSSIAGSWDASFWRKRITIITLSHLRTVSFFWLKM